VLGCSAIRFASLVTRPHRQPPGIATRGYALMASRLILAASPLDVASSGFG
jgi:hypothetical protein